MTTFKAVVCKLESGVYGYQIYAGNDKFADEFGFVSIANSLREMGGEVDPKQAMEITYSHILFGTFTGKELMERSEQIADIAIDRVAALWDAML